LARPKTIAALAFRLTLPEYFELGITLVFLSLLLVLRRRDMARWGGVAGATVTVVFVVRGGQDYTQGVRVMERDFYGVVRTADHPRPVPYRSMQHGSIKHGGQLLGDSLRNTPADYFGPTSGYGRVFTSLREMLGSPTGSPRPPAEAAIGGWSARGLSRS
jgi:hypothetical protein